MAVACHYSKPIFVPVVFPHLSLRQLLVMLLFFTTFIGVLIISRLLMPLSLRIGLVDKPNHRKIHKGTVPLVGGIAIFVATSISTILLIPYSTQMIYLLGGCGVLTLTGSLDDKYNLHYQVRLIVQSLAAYLLIIGSNISLHSLGDLFGSGNLELEFLRIPITILAIVGIVNSFNMIDGLDGLAGGLSLVCVLALLFLLHGKVAEESENILILLLGALSAYLIMNLHLFPGTIPKVFMGDAGSMLLGFILTAFLIRYTQSDKQVFHPITAVWLVALPLIDSILTSIRRYRRGKNPFISDKTHIHHILLHAGLSPIKCLIVLLVFQASCSVLGVVLETTINNELISFTAFLCVTLLYLGFVKHSFRFGQSTKRRMKRRTTS